ncbi:hypothetical protein RJ640_016951 [Escallonia rubra]|uniref:Uncharacterized protein n=1 Tax=Escallonia rubra TaxID=112253 RepID=A0AA88R6M1_9ASTE|nr:hypothetical protein RJ640_016951 [Escallonia rubra]
MARVIHHRIEDFQVGSRRFNIVCTAREQYGYVSPYDEKLKRRQLFLLLCSSGLFPTLPSSGKTEGKNPYDEKRLLEQNTRVQRENKGPEDFPSFVREDLSCAGASENYVKRDSGLIYRDFEVTFHYIGYNESGRRIDSTYLQGRPAKIRFGTNGLVPGGTLKTN